MSKDPSAHSPFALRGIVSIGIAITLLGAGCSEDSKRARKVKVTTETPASDTSDASGSSSSSVEDSSSSSEPTETSSSKSAGGPAFKAVVETADLGGINLGAPTESTVTQLKAVLGDPTRNEGWNEGCPLDGPDLNERSVSWGSLQVDFVRDGSSGDGTLAGWAYHVDPVTFAGKAGGPTPEQIVLPNGVHFGTPISEAGTAVGHAPEDFELVGVTWITTETWTLSADALGSSEPLTTAAVPTIFVCE